MFLSIPVIIILALVVIAMDSKPSAGGSSKSSSTVDEYGDRDYSINNEADYRYEMERAREEYNREYINDTYGEY